MSKHTPEPWGLGTREEGTICTCGGRGLVIYRDQDCNRSLSDSDKARIVACINALAGIPDPEKFVKAARELANQCESVLVVMSLSDSDLDGDQPDLELNNMEDAADEFRAADAPPGK